jgi:hypothetical protein
MLRGSKSVVERDTISLKEASEVLARVERIITGRARRRRHVLLAVSAAMVLALTSTAAVISYRSTGRTLASGGAIEAPATGSPSGDGGTPTSIAKAASLAPFTLYLPNDALASASVESDSWISTSQSDGGSLTRVTTRYSTGIIETMTQANGIDYRQLLNSFPGQAQVISLNGVEALAVAPDADNLQTNVAVVDITIGSTRVVLMGPRPLSDIERVAESLQPLTS